MSRVTKAELLAELHECKAFNKMLTDTTDRKSAAIEKLRTELKDANAKYVKQGNIISALKQAYEEQTEELDTLREALVMQDKVKKDLRRARETNEWLLDQQEKRVADNKSLADRCAAKTVYINTLKKQVKHYEDKLKTMRSLLKGITSVAKDL